MKRYLFNNFEILYFINNIDAILIYEYCAYGVDGEYFENRRYGLILFYN